MTATCDNSQAVKQQTDTTTQNKDENLQAPEAPVTPVEVLDTRTSRQVVFSVLRETGLLSPELSQSAEPSDPSTSRKFSDSDVHSSLPSWLKIDDALADNTNTDQDTSPEQFSYYNVQLEKCLSSLFLFFKNKVQQETESSTATKSYPRLSLSLHPPVYTCDQASKFCRSLESHSPNLNVLAMKNLFLKDKKKRFYLLSACVDTEVKMKELKFAKQLSFASPENLKDKLGLLPGSVTPLGLLNDVEGVVEFQLDRKVVTPVNTDGEEKVNMLDIHPNACNATVCLGVDDFREFVETVGKHKVNVVEE